MQIESDVSEYILFGLRDGWQCVNDSNQLEDGNACVTVTGSPHSLTEKQMVKFHMGSGTRILHRNANRNRYLTMSRARKHEYESDCLFGFTTRSQIFHEKLC